MSQTDEHLYFRINAFRNRLQEIIDDLGNLRSELRFLAGEYEELNLRSLDDAIDAALQQDQELDEMEDKLLADETTDADEDESPTCLDMVDVPSDLSDDLKRILSTCALTGAELDFIDRVLDEGIPQFGAVRDANLARIKQIQLNHLFA